MRTFTHRGEWSQRKAKVKGKKPRERHRCLKWEALEGVSSSGTGKRVRKSLLGEAKVGRGAPTIRPMTWRTAQWLWPVASEEHSTRGAFAELPHLSMAVPSRIQRSSAYHTAVSGDARLTCSETLRLIRPLTSSIPLLDCLSEQALKMRSGPVSGNERARYFYLISGTFLMMWIYPLGLSSVKTAN